MQQQCAIGSSEFFGLAIRNNICQLRRSWAIIAIAEQ